MSKEADKVLELTRKAQNGELTTDEYVDYNAWLQDYAVVLAGQVQLLEDQLKELEAERDKLNDALSRCRGQWIHSIHRDRCLEAIGEKEAPK